MAPKRPVVAGTEKVKKQRKVFTLEEKITILNLLQAGKSISSVAKQYSRNESSIRAIKCREKQIREAVCTASVSCFAKKTSHVRDRALIKTERALLIYLEDMNKRRVPCDCFTLQAKAMELYKKFKPDANEEQLPNVKEFKASKGWLQLFKKRVNIKNLHLSGESASADHTAANLYPETFQKIIDDKGYLPEQVFNADETGLFWKKMPNRTYIARSARQAPGFKAAKDRVTILFCANAAGHLIKPGFIYRAENPRVFKGKNKNLLPVFYQANKKAWMTALLFLDWFNKCFVPEVKSYLERKGIEFKVLLVIDNATSHPDSLKLANKHVEIAFLPPNTTSILQPLDQGVIRCFKAIYTRQSFNRIRNFLEMDPNGSVIQCYKSFTILDCIAAVKEATDSIQPKSIIACWINLWQECGTDFEGFPTIDNDVADIEIAARQIGGEGFDDLQNEEIIALIDSNQEAITDEELLQLANSDTEPLSDDDIEEVPTTTSTWDIPKFNEIFIAAKHLNSIILRNDPSMEHSLKVMNNIKSALKPYEEMYEQLKRKQKQMPITIYLKKTSTNSSSSPQPGPSSLEPINLSSSPQPGSSSLESTNQSSSPQPGPSSIESTNCSSLQPDPSSLESFSDPDESQIINLE
ncbi:unnamed protein product [Rotaria magnacalcarata]|uniref:HTH CENPB-type domain-containing protein n=1 Tax=Rotaria magnacalcarata TaxID=392030 RepID=A0A820GLA4_9BILA|nr:unnamed protein product [Rotaria magnacalcarata]CAF4279542.1 unnamed protein product [Rotaria magnacalcarata]